MPSQVYISSLLVSFPFNEANNHHRTDFDDTVNNIMLIAYHNRDQTGKIAINLK